MVSVLKLIKPRVIPHRVMKQAMSKEAVNASSIALLPLPVLGSRGRAS